MADVYAIIWEGEPRFVSDLAPFRTQQPGGAVIQHPRRRLSRYSPEQRAAHGIHTLAVPEPLPGQVEIGRSLSIEAGEPVLSMTFGPTPVPVAVDMRQARLKLLDEPHGEGSRLDAVEAYVASQDQKAQIEWVHSKELRRDHPLVGIMGLFFEQTSADIDQWFREAAAIGPTLAL